MAILRASATLACLLAACLIGVFSLDASAQDASALDTLHDRYPPSSIDSVTKADAAIAATSTAKGQADKDYRAQAKACLSKVLVNVCLDGVRTVQRKRLADITAIELEANRFKRKDKADRLDADRAKHEAERAAKAPTEEAERARNRKTYEGKQADAARAAESEAKRADTASRTRKPVVKLAPPAVADPAQRAKNVASYEAHQQEAKEHQVELTRRLAEKTADRKRRADAKAAKDAKLNAAAGASSPPPTTAGPTP